MDYITCTLVGRGFNPSIGTKDVQTITPYPTATPDLTFQSLNRDKGRSNEDAEYSASCPSKFQSLNRDKGRSNREFGIQNFDGVLVSIPQSGQRTFKRGGAILLAKAMQGFNPSIGTKDVQTSAGCCCASSGGRFQSLNRDKGRSNRRTNRRERMGEIMFQSLNRDKGRSNPRAQKRKEGLLCRVSIPQSGQRTFKQALGALLRFLMDKFQSLNRDKGRSNNTPCPHFRTTPFRGFNPSIGTKDVQTSFDLRLSPSREGFQSLNRDKGRSNIILVPFWLVGKHGFNPSIGTKDVQTSSKVGGRRSD